MWDVSGGLSVGLDGPGSQNPWSLLPEADVGVASTCRLPVAAPSLAAGLQVLFPAASQASMLSENPKGRPSEPRAGYICSREL